jgi:hypothetical protein
MELNHRAIQGDGDAQKFWEQESQQWIESLLVLTQDRATAIAIFHLFQGAILDFLTPANLARGRDAITIFIKTLP